MYQLAGLTAIIWFLLVLLAQGVSGFKYWVDRSCTEADAVRDRFTKRKFEPALAEALYMARRTAARMQEISGGVVPPPGNDIPGQLNNAILNLRFKGDFTNHAVVQQVFQTFNTVADYSESTVQDQAEIRFYCDNDAGNRMTLVPDIPNVDYSQIGEVPNSQRAEHQELVDRRNGVRGLNRERPCQLNNVEVYAYTMAALDPDPIYATQNQNRAVIVICDHSFNQIQNTFQGVTDSELARINKIDELATIGTHAYLHEMLHAHPLWAIDVVITPAIGATPAVVAYKWTLPLALSQADALQNVDSYTYYAMSTILADRGSCLLNVPGHFELGELVRNQACKPSTAPTKKRSIEENNTYEGKGDGKRWIEFVA